MYEKMYSNLIISLILGETIKVWYNRDARYNREHLKINESDNKQEDVLYLSTKY